MEKFGELVKGLLHETEVVLNRIKDFEGSEEAVELVNRVQTAIKNNDIEELNKIIEENGDKVNRK